MRLAPRLPIKTEVEEFALEEANEALSRLRAGEVRGAAVLAKGTQTQGSPAGG